MEKGKYKTQHKEELQKYLSNLEGEHFTVADLVIHFREEGRPSEPPLFTGSWNGFAKKVW